MVCVGEDGLRSSKGHVRLRERAGTTWHPRSAAPGTRARRNEARSWWRVGLPGHLLALPWWIVPLTVAVLTTVASLVVTPSWGFGVDDSWIHQTFARTLATTGRFAFQPGDGPAGSTSPVWVVLLTPPYLLAHGHPSIEVVVGWVAGLGALTLGGLGIVSGIAAMDLARRAGKSWRERRVMALIASLAVVTSWQMIVFALSGMETIFFALGALFFLLMASRGLPPIWLGLLGAALVTTRPEGVIPAALVLLGSGWTVGRAAFFSRAPALALQGILHAPHTRVRLIAASRRVWPVLAWWSRAWAMPYLLALGVGLVPYVALNLVASGHVLPTTVYAKSVTSSIGDSVALRFQTIASYVGLLLTYSPALLALAALFGIHWLLGRRATIAARRSVSEPGADVSRSAATDATDVPTFALDTTPHIAPERAQRAVSTAPTLAALLWLWPALLVLAFSGNYTGVVYRYLVPALPPLLVLTAVAATPIFFSKRQLVAIVALLGLVAIAGISDVRGVQTYAYTVAATNQCAVADAIWIRDHIPPNALLATHDVGAIGYFDQNRLVDIAGLVTPDIIPLLNNERAIEAYLQQHHVKYVMMWKDWFPPPALIAHQFADRVVFTGCDSKFDLYDTNW